MKRFVNEPIPYLDTFEDLHGALFQSEFHAILSREHNIALGANISTNLYEEG